MAARCEAYVFCACALAALVQLPGCSDDAVSVHVICPIVPDVEGNICSFDPGGDTCITAGIMNIAATRYYRKN